MTDLQVDQREVKPSAPLLKIPIVDGPPIELPLGPGKVIYVVGPNGAGKSALMGYLTAQAPGDSFRRISAHRQNWTAADASTFASSERMNQEQSTRSLDARVDRRHMDHSPQSYTSLALTHLIAAENLFQRQLYSDCLASGKPQADFEATRIRSPLEKINQILERSSLSIVLSIDGNESLNALVRGGETIGVSRLSDGERNAVFLTSEVLTAAAGTTFFVDEPERHLHRGIMTPLLRAVFSARPDCAFVIATHELSLPLDDDDAKLVLLYGTGWDTDGNPVKFKAELFPPDANFPEGVREAILGSRDRVLFIEGTRDASLDLTIYSLLLSGISAQPIGGCSEVITAVKRMQDAGPLHWVKPYGLIDRDGRSEADLQKLQSRQIFATKTSTVEGIYYSREAMLAIAERAAGGAQLVADAEAKAFAKLATPHTQERMCILRVVSTARDLISKSLPVGVEAQPHVITVDMPELLRVETDHYQKLVANRDLSAMMSRYALKKTDCFESLALGLGFKVRKDYEQAVLNQIQGDRKLLKALQGLLGGVADALTPPAAGAEVHSVNAS